MFAAAGWELPPDDLYFKDAASAFRGGGISKRTDFQRMIELARAGIIRGFAVHTPDRYFRNAFNSFASYPELRDAGIEGWVADPDGHWNMFDPAHEERFMREMVDSHNFSRRMSRHITKGKNRVAEAGLFNGSRFPRGWTKDPETGEPVPTGELPLIQAAADRYLTGDISLRQLAAEMKAQGLDLTPGNWGKIFNNPFYAGLVPRPNDTGQPRRRRMAELNLNDFHPGRHIDRAAWSIETWDDLRRAMLKHKIGGRGAHTVARDYIVGAGLGRCSHCGRGLTGQTRIYDNVRFYICSATVRGFDCPARTRNVRQDTIAAQIGDILKHFTIPSNWKEQIAQGIAQATPAARRRDAARRRIRESREAAYRDIGSKRITPTEFIARLNDLDAEEARAASDRRAATIDVEQLAESLKDVSTVWGRMPDARRRNVARLMFSRVEIDPVEKRILAFELAPDMDVLFNVTPALTHSPARLAQDKKNPLRFVVQWSGTPPNRG